MLKDLKALASFENPQVKILESLRKPIYNIAKNIYSYEQIDNQLILPRGLMRSVIELFKYNNIDATFEDERFSSIYKFPKLKYKLREEQELAIKNIIKKDFSLCIAPPGFGKTLIGAKMCENRAVNTLVIVNKNILLDQWIERFESYFG